MEDHEAGVELTYKSLVLGAWRVVIGVCVVFGGCIGWWITHFVSAVETYQAGARENFAQLETRVSKLEWERDHGVRKPEPPKDSHQ